MRGRGWPGWSWVRKGRAVGSGAEVREREQDAQDLLGHRKDWTGSQTRSALDLNRIVNTSAAVKNSLWGAGAQAGSTGGGGPAVIQACPPHVARLLPPSRLSTRTFDVSR